MRRPSGSKRAFVENTYFLTYALLWATDELRADPRYRHLRARRGL